ncbi:hypothetical protein JHK87_012226 [Glycine soja]|nr:hypothetical protein JHK87_012226 [Glycine soja]
MVTLFDATIVLVKGLSGESVGNGSEVCGYDEEVMVGSFGSNSLGLDSSTLVGESSTKRESSDFSTFLNQLPERVGENITTLVAVVAAQLRPLTEVRSQPKEHLALKEASVPLPIMLLRYTWVDGESSLFCALNSKGSTDDEVALMSRKFKQMMTKKGRVSAINGVEDTKKAFLEDWFIPRKWVNFQSLVGNGFVVKDLLDRVS